MGNMTMITFWIVVLLHEGMQNIKVGGYDGPLKWYINWPILVIPKEIEGVNLCDS